MFKFDSYFIFFFGCLQKIKYKKQCNEQFEDLVAQLRDEVEEKTTTAANSKKKTTAAAAAKKGRKKK